MKRKRKIDVDVMREITSLAMEGHGGTAIQRHLENDPRFSTDSKNATNKRVPNVKTIQRVVRELTAPDTSDSWSLADAEADEARIMLPVVKAVVERTDGRVWPSKDLARWIVKIATAVPRFDAWQTYVYATLYRARVANGQPTKDLDTILSGATLTFENERSGVAFLYELLIAKDAPELLDREAKM